MPKITLIGPGAIGGMAAAWLCQDASNDVTIAARTPFRGLTLETPEGPLVTDPVVLTRPKDASVSDWVMVATKAYDSRSAAEWFPATVREKTRVAVLQNGVDHVDRFSEWLPRDQILPVIFDCPTERSVPGTIRQRGPAMMTVPDGTLGKTFAALFAQTAIDCRLDGDFVTAAWWKLCLNAAGVVNALTLQPAGISHDENAARLMRRIVEEAAAVGRAEGAALGPDIADEIVGIYRRQPPDSVNSLHADRAAGRPLEIGLRNGVIVVRGKRHGIETPCNDMAVTVLSLSDRTS